MQEYPTLAAIDLGSNSFHLQVGRADGDQRYYRDSHKEAVRLAGGLTADKRLDEASQKRALACLARIGERIEGMPPGAVRAVGTSALRVAKNSDEFLEKARAALGFDIEIVAGREEARLIYLGVSHSLPGSDQTRLIGNEAAYNGQPDGFHNAADINANASCRLLFTSPMLSPRSP